MSPEQEQMLEGIIICGRLPKRADETVDLYKVNRLLLEVTETNHRIAILRRLLERPVNVTYDRNLNDYVTAEGVDLTTARLRCQ